MAGLKMHKVRSFMASVVALILAFVVISFALVAAGINLPVFNILPRMVGFGG